MIWHIALLAAGKVKLTNTIAVARSEVLPINIFDPKCTLLKVLFREPKKGQVTVLLSVGVTFHSSTVLGTLG